MDINRLNWRPSCVLAIFFRLASVLVHNGWYKTRPKCEALLHPNPLSFGLLQLWYASPISPRHAQNILQFAGRQRSRRLWQWSLERSSIDHHCRGLCAKVHRPKAYNSGFRDTLRISQKAKGALQALPSARRMRREASASAFPPRILRSCWVGANLPPGLRSITNDGQPYFIAPPSHSFWQQLTPYVYNSLSEHQLKFLTAIWLPYADNLIHEPAYNCQRIRGLTRPIHMGGRGIYANADGVSATLREVF